MNKNRIKAKRLKLKMRKKNAIKIENEIRIKPQVKPK